MPNASSLNRYVFSGLLFCLPIAYAAEPPPLDLIELLGSFEDEDTDNLDAAMAEIRLPSSSETTESRKEKALESPVVGDENETQ